MPLKIVDTSSVIAKLDRIYAEFGKISLFFDDLFCLEEFKSVNEPEIASQEFKRFCRKRVLNVISSP